MDRREFGLPLLRRIGAAAAAAFVVVLFAAPAVAQTSGTAHEPDGYDFFAVSGLADGISTHLTLQHFLAIEELVALSSVSAEARLEVGRSTALAVLPDPGDLVLGLSGTLAALAGIAGLPDYPAVSRAEYPSTPTNELSLAPDAGLGALRLETEAQEHNSHGKAFVTDLVNTVGVVPMTIGSIKADSVARRVDPVTYESTATSTISDVRILQGLLRIGSVTTTVTARVDDGKFTATRDDTKVAGVSIAGMPVGIDENGFTSPGGSQALAPIIDSLAAPLAAAGISVHFTPGTTTTSATQAVAESGFLEISFTTPGPQLYPLVITISLGKANATVAASGAHDEAGAAGDIAGGGTSGTSGGPLAVGGLSASGGDLTGAASDLTGALGANGETVGSGSANTASRATIAAALKPIDFRSFYRWFALALAGAVIARWWVVTRLRGRDLSTRPNLRSLWRW